MGALDATTGASLPWAVSSIAYDYGSDAAIYSLTSDGDSVYGTGYNFLVHPQDTTTGGNFENTFAAKAAGGDLVWISGCRGDTYSAAVLNGVVYNVGHAHDCSPSAATPRPTRAATSTPSRTSGAGGRRAGQHRRHTSTAGLLPRAAALVPELVDGATRSSARPRGASAATATTSSSAASSPA